MRTTGQKITIEEFKRMIRGDLYWITDENEARAFTRHAKCFAKRGEAKAVNSDGKVNALSDMRWLSKAEHDKWRGYDADALKKSEPKQCYADKSVGPDKPKTSDYDTYKHYGTEKAEDVKMSAMSVMNKQLTMVKHDAVDASYRVAAKQLLKSARLPLQAFLSKQKLPSGALMLVEGVLETQNGEAAFSLLLGTAMNYLPSLTNDPKVDRLAKELRVYGMDNFLSQIADAVLEPLRQSILEVVKQLPFGNSDQ